MKRYTAALLLAALVGCVDDSLPPADRPAHAGVNVLLITVDTLRADHMSTYGYRRRTTPSVDELAARGVVFERAFTYWPKTRGSFAALFTSLYASQHGLTVRDRDLPAFNRTLAEVLRDVGYTTAAAVDNGNLDRSLGFAQGFDRYEQVWLDEKAETEADRTEALTRFATEFLEKADSSAPFFLWVHYVNPHTPYEPPEELLAPFREDGLVPRGPRLEPVVGFHGGVNRHLALPGEEHLGDYIDRYDAEIVFADRHVGRVLAALEASGQRSATLVVFTSDHGESLGEHDYFFDHGHDLFDPSLQVPLVLSFPGILPSGGRVPAPVSTLDIVPTILDLARVSFPPGVQGRSVLPLVRRSTDELHERLFFQNDQHQIAISNGRLKLISYPESEEEEARYELYDLARDPGEVENLYPAAGQRVAPFEAELERFRTRSVAWQQETNRQRRGEPARRDEELSEKTRRNLEALGYLGGSRKPKEKE